MRINLFTTLMIVGVVFLPIQLSAGTPNQANAKMPESIDFRTDSGPDFAQELRQGMQARMTNLLTTGPLSLSLPFDTLSYWSSAPSSTPSIKWQTGDTTTRFAVKNGKFISTDTADTWFVYGWFGSIEAITRPYNIKYPRWGNRHNGIDFAGREGLDIISASGGVVVFTGNDIGNTVMINVKDNYYITYGHLLDISVEIGDIITPGDLIGHLGNTDTVNSHLHFQIDKIEENQKTAINPIPLIDIDWDNVVIPNADANRFYAGSNNPKLQPNFTWI